MLPILKESNESKFKLRSMTALMFFTAVIWLASFQSSFAQQGGTANYFYDANGRLTAVLSPTGEAAIYNYDTAGNFTSITRYAANQLSILDFTPGSGGIGTQVTIYGTGFSTTPSANTVKFNSTTASVTAATNIQLTVTVPAGATTGPINIANTNGSINSSSNFFVVGNVEFSNHMVVGESAAIAFAATGTAPLTKVGMLTFDGVANQRISLIVEDLNSCSTNSNIPPFNYAQISIISPAGVSIASVPLRNYWFNYPPPNNDYYPTNGSSDTRDASFAWVEAMVLPATGRYTILIDPNDPYHCFTGQYGFSATARLYDVTPDISGTITASGLPTPIGFNSPGQNAVLTFAGLNGQRICLKGSQDIATQIRTFVKLYAPGTYPSGAPLSTQYLTSETFLDTTTLTANGTYTISIDPHFNKLRTTTFTLYDVPPDVSAILTVYSPSPPPPHTLVTIPSVGQAANLTFNVPINQQVTIHITELRIGGSSTLTLSTQGGTQILTQIINYFAEYNIQQTLSPGNYVIRIDPSQTLTGSLEIYLTTP